MTSYTWLVTEDLKGVLSLYVFEGSTEVVLFARDHYERRPGQLRADLEVLRRGDGPRGFGPGLADAQARWDSLGEAGADKGGFWVIADEEGVIPAEAMGAAAREELFPRSGVRGED